MKGRILIFEDDIELSQEWKRFLENKNYIIEESNGDNYHIFLEDINNFNLILLDINLKNINGFEICSSIRELSEIPIIFLTSRTSNLDEIMGLSIGGDDFIKKPYNPGVLLARIENILNKNINKDIILYKGVELDTKKFTLIYNNKKINLTISEYLILHYLMEHGGEIISRMELIEYLWDNESFIDDNTLSVHISRIRKKLEGISLYDFIKTKPKQGYLIWK